MSRGSLHETTFPRVKKYMSEIGKAVKLKDIAEALEMSTGGAYNVMQLMMVFNMVQKVKRAGTYFVLSGLSDEQIDAMFPPKKVTPKPRRRRSSLRANYTPRSQASSPRQSSAPFDDSFMEEYLFAVRAEPISGEGLSALAVIGLSRQETADEVTLTKELPEDLDIDDLGIDIEVEERKSGAPIRNEPFATVKYLPKEVRLLNSGETRYLKNKLKALEGYEGIAGLGSVFAKFSALKYGRYGSILFFSLGMNEWDYVKKVTIDRSISDFMLLPTFERNRWSSWNHFIGSLEGAREKYGRKEYEKIINQFMESGHQLVEITVKNRGTIHVKNMLNKNIVERGLEEQIKASRVDSWIYLEKVHQAPSRKPPISIGGGIGA